MTLRCRFRGHDLGPPVEIRMSDGRTVLAVRCANCDYVSSGITVPSRPIADRWNPNDTYWRTPAGQAWLDSQPVSPRRRAS
jgi:hypothetical protein